MRQPQDRHGSTGQQPSRNNDSGDLAGKDGDGGGVFDKGEAWGVGAFRVVRNVVETTFYAPAVDLVALDDLQHGVFLSCF